MATDTAVNVRFEAQPLVQQYAALFTTECGTEYQIMLWDGQDTVRFGVRNAGDWSYGTFRYADTWRERNGWPSWDKATFRRMIADFLAE